MSEALPSAEIRAYVSSHLAIVFDTMLSMKAEPGPAQPPAEFNGARVTGSVGIAGEKVTGQIYLHLTAPLAAKATAAMLGLAIEEISGEAEVNDVIGEVTNMIGGGLKSWLCDNRATCALTTPAVIRGTSFTVMPKPGVECLFVHFECLSDPGLVEIHIRFS